MTDQAQAPTGMARRRRRLSDEETERRMLQAAVEMVNQTGLTVSLDHLSFEDVIRDARVSRSTVYRRWPYKDLFFSDLLKELARAATPAAISSEASALSLLKRVLLEHDDWLATPDLRHNLLLEMIRLGSLHDFDTMNGSTEWRTYIALHATFISVAGDELRSDIRTVLAQSERAFISRIAVSWERLAGLFGYRIRPEFDATFATIAGLASADLRGHVLMALANPDIATHRFHARPFDAVQSADWSAPAIAIASIAMAVLEPDPTIDWDDDRIADVRRTFDSM